MRSPHWSGKVLALLMLLALPVLGFGVHLALGLGISLWTLYVLGAVPWIAGLFEAYSGPGWPVVLYAQMVILFCLMWLLPLFLLVCLIGMPHALWHRCRAVLGLPLRRNKRQPGRKLSTAERTEMQRQRSLLAEDLVRNPVPSPLWLNASAGFPAAVKSAPLMGEPGTSLEMSFQMSQKSPEGRCPVAARRPH